MKNTEHGQITRLCAGGQFIAATGITGAVDAHTQSNYTTEGLNQNRAAHKTKATPKDRQWLRTKPIQNSRYQAGGLGKILRPQIEDGKCRQLATVGRVQKCTLAYSRSLGLPSRLPLRLLHRDSKYSSRANEIGLVSGLFGGFLPGSFLVMGYAFGSMPRCCNSLRSMRFIQVANDESPSLRISSSSWARKSSGSRIWYCGDFFNSCIDTCNYPYCYLNVITRVVTFELKSNAPKCSRTPRRLTTNQQKLTIIVQKVAMRNNNTQRVKGLPFTVCNVYGQCTAWRTSIAVYDHFSAISRMHHAAHNGAVFFDGVGLAPTNTATNDTPRRPPMVLLVGGRSRSLAILLASLPTPASDTTSTAVKKHLRTDNGLGYVNSAPYKTGAGRGNPKLIKATPDAASVFFCVCYMRHFMAWCVIRQRSYNRRSVALLAYHAAHNGVMCSYRCAGSYPLAPMSTSRRPIMVTLAGQPQGWPVPFIAGISTPVNVTAPIERGNSSGDSLNQIKEAA